METKFITKMIIINFELLSFDILQKPGLSS